jgi:hypothetical protein
LGFTQSRAKAQSFLSALSRQSSLSPAQYGFLGLVIASSFFIASFLSLRLNKVYSSERAISVGAGISCFGSILLHNGTGLAMPLYFVGITGGMWALSVMGNEKFRNAATI